MLRITTNKRYLLLSMLIGLSLAACSSSLDIAKTKMPSSEHFEKTLYQQYLRLSKLEHAEYDRADETKFANRAIAAAIGSPSQPEALNARDIPIEFHGEMLAARRQLMEVLDAGARYKAPEYAARAQAAFDCWLQEREENFQFDDIQNCQDQFDVAMYFVRAKLRPKVIRQPKGSKSAQPAAAPAKAETVLPMQFTIYFAFDSAALDETAMETVAKVATVTTAEKPSEITIAGYTDRAGTEAYNLGLSALRAKNVTEALRSLIDDRLQVTITITKFGETANQIVTSDGVREAKNRRTTINIQK